MGRHMLILLLHHPIALMDESSEFIRGVSQQRYGNDDGGREWSVDAYHPEEGKGERSDRIGGVHDGRTDELAHGADVAVEVCEDLSGGALMEERSALTLKRGRKVVSQILFHVATHHDDRATRGPHEEAAADGQTKDLSHKDEHGRLVDDGILEHVDGRTDHARNRRRTDVRDRDAEQAQPDKSAVAPDIGQQSPEFSHRPLWTFR